MVLCDPVSDEEYARRNRYCRRPYCHHPPRFFTIFLFKIHAIHSKYSTESRFCQGGAPFFCTAVPEAPPALPIPATYSLFARRPFLPAGEKQDAAYGNLHNCLPVRSEPAFSALAAVRCRPRRIYKVFREAFLQKGRHPRRGALPAAPAHPLLPARQRLLVRPYPRPGRIHGAPGLAACLSPPAPKAADLCTPARNGTPCAPSVPSRGIRRRNGRGGGYRPGMGPVWRQHRRQFTQKGSIEPAVALAAVRCRPRRIYKVFRQAFLQKGRHPRGVLPAAYAGFSRGLFAKRPTARAAALYLPRRPSSAPPARQRFSCPPVVSARRGETGRGGQNPLQIPLRVAREIHLPTALSL